MAISWTEIGYIGGAITGSAVFVHTLLQIQIAWGNLKKLRAERKRGSIVTPTPEEIERYSMTSRELEFKERLRSRSALHGAAALGIGLAAMALRDYLVFVLSFVLLIVLAGYITLVFLRHLTKRARTEDQGQT